MKMRLFVALGPSEDVRRELVAMRTELEAVISGVHWVPEENIHLTLRFLGSTSEADVPAIQTSVAEAAATCSPLLFDVHGAGGFPNAHRARVLWAGVGGSDTDRLSVLRQDLERRLNDVGVPPEDHSFHPHLTLGRARDRRGLHGADDPLASLAHRKAVPWRVAEVYLMRSHLSPDGARYEVIQRAPLARNQGPE